jgi:hypothetical protein
MTNKCNICRQEYTPACDYNQGRCPHHKPMIEIQPRDTSRGHFYVSLAKSALRIVAGGNLVLGNLFWAGTFLILAEVLGIVEELV